MSRSRVTWGSGTGGYGCVVLKVGVGEGAQVVRGGLDGDAEEVAEATVVAAGVDLGEDAVLAHCAGWDAELVGEPGGPDGFEGGCGPAVHEEVRVDAAGPAVVSVEEVPVQRGLGGVGEQDRAVWQVDPVVMDVDQLEGAGFGGPQPVDADQRGDRGGGWVGGVEQVFPNR